VKTEVTCIIVITVTDRKVWAYLKIRKGNLLTAVRNFCSGVSCSSPTVVSWEHCCI